MSPSRLLDEPAVRRFEPPEIEPGGSAPRDPSEAHDGEQALARRLAETVRAGYAEGLERGQRDAADAAERQQYAAAERLARALVTLHGLERQILHEVRAEVSELSLAIASRIVRERIAAGDAVAERAVREIFSRIDAGVGRRVRLHPADVEAVTAAAQQLAQPGSVELVADPTLERGSVVVEGADEDVDARIATALEAFRDALEDPE